eukprot:TsM_001081100 transcript=TsM_001081100 gene=TsM_001081100
MLTGHQMRVPSYIFLLSREVAAHNAQDYVLRPKEGMKKTFNIAWRRLQKSYSRQKKYYDKHSRPSTYHEGDLVQIYRPILLPGMYRKFCRTWRKDPYRAVKSSRPTNYLIRNAELRTQPTTIHHNDIQPYKDTPPVGYEGELCAILEKRKSFDGIKGAKKTKGCLMVEGEG